MPKKMGINTKAVEAKARKENVKKAKDEQIQKQKEDEFWRDDDKLVNRKLDRQNERDKKRMEQAQKKAQNKAAYEEELSQLGPSKPAHTNKPKVTRAHIQSFVAKQIEEKEKEASNKEATHLEVEIVENVNRLTIEGDEARNIEEAITILRYVLGRPFDKCPSLWPLLPSTNAFLYIFAVIITNPRRTDTLNGA